MRYELESYKVEPFKDMRMELVPGSDWYLVKKEDWSTIITYYSLAAKDARICKNFLQHLTELIAEYFLYEDEYHKNYVQDLLKKINDTVLYG